jgi:hypothetical protein
MRPLGEGTLVPIPPRARAATPPSWPVRLFGLALLLAAAALLIGVQPAAAKTPCWKTVVEDWFDDSTIDRVYERHCYRDALENVGEDVRVYSSFEEDIKAALQRVSRADVRELSGVGGSGGDQPPQGLFKDAFGKTTPRNADSMPIPLLILGGLALLLIAAGAAGLLRRRLRARRPSAP